MLCKDMLLLFYYEACFFFLFAIQQIVSFGGSVRFVVRHCETGWYIFCVEHENKCWFVNISNDYYENTLSRLVSDKICIPIRAHSISKQLQTTMNHSTLRAFECNTRSNQRPNNRNDYNTTHTMRETAIVRSHLSFRSLISKAHPPHLSQVQCTWIAYTQLTALSN